MRFRYVTMLAMVLIGGKAWSLEPADDALFCRVVDVGAGECCVIVIPGGHYVVFDGGNYKDGGATAMTALEELLPDDAEIGLLVISHSDSDHLGAVDEIFDAYKVKTVLHTGDERTTQNWKAADAAIRAAVDNGLTENLNLKDSPIQLGHEFKFDDAKVTFVAGWHSAPREFGTLNNAEKNNAISVVVRVEYHGKSILITGDSVGRHIDDPPDACIAAEQFMVENRSIRPIRSDVLVAAHHGADNGSSSKFIEAVQPQFVVFSAGHAFQHPRSATVGRFQASGLSPESLFRTDRGDDEGSKEWDGLRIPGNIDPSGDDDVDILIRNNGEIEVEYRNPDPEVESIRRLVAGTGARLSPSAISAFGPTGIVDRFEPRSTAGSLPSEHAVATTGVADLTRLMAATEERLLTQIRSLQADVERCQRDSQTAREMRPQPDPVDLARKLVEIVRESDRKREPLPQPPQPGEHREWIIAAVAAGSAILTLLFCSLWITVSSVRRLEILVLNGRQPPVVRHHADRKDCSPPQSAAI